MNKQTIMKTLKNIPKVLKKHSPEILTGVGIAGMIFTTIAAVRATPKALQLIHERESKEKQPLTIEKAIKTTWKYYIPATITGVCSIACIIGASSVNARRHAALATAYAISVSDLNEYKKKVLKVVGEKKEQMIRHEVAKDKMEKSHVEDRQIIITGKGETPCYDPLTDRYFKSDIETIRKVENILNKRMLEQNYIMLNEFFGEIGLDECDLGDMLGWDIDKGYINFDFSSQLDKNGVPCLILGHYNPPRYIAWS